MSTLKRLVALSFVVNGQVQATVERYRTFEDHDDVVDARYTITQIADLRSGESVTGVEIGPMLTVKVSIVDSEGNTRTEELNFDDD